MEGKLYRPDWSEAILVTVTHSRGPGHEAGHSQSQILEKGETEQITI